MTTPEDARYSLLQELHRSKILCLLVWLTACYPQLGQPTPDDPATLLKGAQTACHRQDRVAARTLSERLLAAHPEAAQAAKARAYLDDQARCDLLTAD